MPIDAKAERSGVEERARRAAERIHASNCLCSTRPELMASSWHRERCDGDRESLTAIILSEFADAPALPSITEAFRYGHRCEDHPTEEWPHEGCGAAGIPAPRPASAERERAFEEARNLRNEVLRLLGTNHYFDEGDYSIVRHDHTDRMTWCNNVFRALQRFDNELGIPPQPPKETGGEDVKF